MHLPRLLILVGVATLGACSLSTDLPTTRPLGIVVLTDTVDADSNTLNRRRTYLETDNAQRKSV